MKPITKICPRCRQTFECKHDDIASCECSTVHLTAEMHQYIGDNYAECLCVFCLKEIRDSFHAIAVNPVYENTPDKFSLK